MAERTDVSWPVCEAADCAGIQLASGRLCLAHASGPERDAALNQLSTTGAIDARGVQISDQLLEQVLAAAQRGKNGKALFKASRFDRAIFDGDVVFDGVRFDDDWTLTTPSSRSRCRSRSAQPGFAAAERDSLAACSSDCGGPRSYWTTPTFPRRRSSQASPAYPATCWPHGRSGSPRPGNGSWLGRSPRGRNCKEHSIWIEGESHWEIDGEEVSDDIARLVIRHAHELESK
jgi:hypothetical protein